jgi:hypothetical protein
LRKRFIRGELAKEALERIFVSSVRIVLVLGIATRPLIMKEVRRLYNPLKRRSDFRPARFLPKLQTGGRASPDAEERDSMRLQKWRVVLLMVAAGPAQVVEPELSAGDYKGGIKTNA